MKYVYILESIKTPGRHYTGITDNVKRRLRMHNAGNVPYSKRHIPWQLISYFYFNDEEKALRFEKYLKSGSGCGFSKRHF